MTEYLTVEELSSRIKYSKQSLYNLVSRNVFELHRHYVKPTPKKLLFKWDAIVEWLESKSTPESKPDEDITKRSLPKSSTETIKTSKNMINI